METTGNKVKNALGSNSRLDQVEDKDLEKSKTGHWKFDLFSGENKGNKRMDRGGESIHEPWETIKETSTVTEVPEREERTRI